MARRKRKSSVESAKRAASRSGKVVKGKQAANEAQATPIPDADAAGSTGETQQLADFPIVGIGASAGGLDAVSRFFDAMPGDAGMAFVLIQHLDPTRVSLTPELLAKHTPMPVGEARDQVLVERNHVYVIPPNKYLSISGGRLHLSEPAEQRGARLSIDFFLRSLAREKHEKAIAIILSGTGSDGTLGTKAVKANGGLSIVQDPPTAEHEGMPRSAIATDVVDYVLPVDKMPAVLAGYAQHPYVNGDPAVTAAVSEPPKDINGILALLRARTKFDFRSYKKKTLIRRTARRMSLRHIEHVSEYLDLLRENQAEIDALVKDLLISVTDFFREPEAWLELERAVLVPLIRAKQDDEPIRVWVPGCATGEEPYSVAMLLIEQLQRMQKSCPVQVFATDVDKDVLAFARTGLYPASIVADVSTERLRRFFVEHRGDHTFEVTKLLREIVIFAEQNLISDPPFSKLDLICCRNLLIYLEQDVQEKIIALFHFALSEGGHIFLGNAETIGRQQDLFRPVSSKWRIFRRIGPAHPERLEFPVLPGMPRRELESVATPNQRREHRIANLAQRRLLEQFAPVGVLIDRNFEILYFSGPTDDFLVQPTGLPTQNLLERARDGLRIKLRSAAHKALTENHAVKVDAVVKRGRVSFACNINIVPVRDFEEDATLLLVIFEKPAEDSAPPLVGRPAPPARNDASAQESPVATEDAVIRHLEQELATTKDDLQGTIEQLETSNEELKAANEEVMSINEELQSTNEELETSKEELQSLNEELSTVNSQLSAKVAELESRNDDLSNLLTSTDIPAICLDQDFCIKWFTPAITSLVRVAQADIGRPLADFAHRFNNAELLRSAERVLKTLVPVECEVHTEDDRWLQQRVIPFRTADNHIDGVVVTYSDITTRRLAEQEIRRLNESLEQEVAHRTNLLRLVHDTTMAANEADNIEEAIEFALARVCEHNDWQLAHVYRRVDDDGGELVPTGIFYTTPGRDYPAFRDVTMRTRFKESGRGLIRNAVRTGTAQWITDLSKSSDYVRDDGVALGVHSAAAFPVRVRNNVVAVLEFYSEDAMQRDVRFEHAMDTIGTQLGQVIQRKRFEKELAEFADRQQQRIGQELHDSLGQQVSAIGMIATSLAQMLSDMSSPATETAARLVRLIDATKQGLGDIMHTLLPIEISAVQLDDALSLLAQQTTLDHHVHCDFVCATDVAIADNFLATQLYLIAREATHNAVKHAHARQIIIRLQDGGHETLSIEDDGTGIREASRIEKGEGIRIMRRRAELIDGIFEVVPRPGGGTVVRCSLRSNLFE